MSLFKYLVSSSLFLSTSLLAGGLSFSGDVNFANTKLGSSKTSIIRLKNNSRRKIRLDDGWFENTNEFKFKTQTCSFDGTALTKGKECTLSLTYTPREVETYEAKFVVSFKKGRSSRYKERYIKILASAVQDGQSSPNQELALEVVDSKKLETRQNEELKIKFKVKNTLDHKIRIDEFWFNNKPKKFSFDIGNCPKNLYSNQECQFDVIFKDPTEGRHNDILTIGHYKNDSWAWNELDYKFSILVNKSDNTTIPPKTPAEGRLHVEGNKIVNDDGKQVILRGVNIADPEHLNTKTRTRPGVSAHSVAMKAVDEFNAKVVRLPILPGSPDYPTEGWFGPHNGGESYFENHIDPLVEELTSKNVYVIIDLHYISDYMDLQDDVLEFWKFMAPKYKDNPYVIYELINEPILPDDWDTFKRVIAAPGVKMIRKHAPDNLIIVGSPYWSSHLQGITDNPIDSHNIIYTAHIYSNQKEYTWEKNYGEVIAKYPVMVTEWGFEQGGVEGGTKNFGIPFMDFMARNNLSWTAWCFDNRWGPRMFDEDWNLKKGHGGMGQFVKDHLE